MKRLGIVLAGVLLAGCVSSENLKEDFKTMMTDPKSDEHQKTLEALERSYLKSEITYAEYQDKKKQEEESYSKQMQHRDEILHHENPVIHDNPMAL